MNASVGEDQKPFVVIGDLKSNELRLFLFRVKCNVYCDYFVLCPLRKNLEANLQNHVISLIHIKVVDDLWEKATPATLLTRRQGRPSKSASTIEGSQQSLQAWFSPSSKTSQSTSSSTSLESIMLYLCWGYWIPTCLYGGRPYLVHDLLNFPHCARATYSCRN